MKQLALLLVAVLLVVQCAGCEAETPEPTPVPATSTALPTDVPEPTPTDTATPEPTPTPTKTVEPTPDLVAATCVEVIDGDTIKVDIDGTVYRVRYIGIDCPEMGQQFGGEASEANRLLVEGQELLLEKDVSEVDRYDRLLRYVYLATGMFVNAELVRTGYAIAKQYPPDVKYAAEFAEMQREAEDDGLLGWLTPVPTVAPTAIPTPVATAVPPTAVPVPTAVPPTPVPVPPTAVPAPVPDANCDPAYPHVCIPSPPPDLDCGDIPYRRFRVLPPDPHGFDADNDGIGCESG